MTYFYFEVPGGKRKLSTESEFSENDLVLDVVPGKNYFVRQSIKMGVFVGGAKLERVREEEGKQGVLECKLARNLNGNVMVSAGAINTPSIASQSEPASGKSVFDYYGQAEDEIVTKTYDKNLWARALVEANGDEQKRKARYIELRAQQLGGQADEASQGSKIGKSTTEQIRDKQINLADIVGTYSSQIISEDLYTFRKQFRDLEVTFEKGGDGITALTSYPHITIIPTLAGDTITFTTRSDMLCNCSYLDGKWTINGDGTLSGSYSRGGGAGGEWNLQKIY